MKEGWTRVSKQKPCPICSKTTWCGTSSDGAVVVCMRMVSDKPATGPMGGWVHRLKDADKPLRPYVRPIAVKEKPKVSAADVMARIRESTTAEMIVAYAEGLGVDPIAIDALGAGWSQEHRAWAFPMRNAAGDVMGIRLRADDGKKWAVKGYTIGLFYDVGLLTPGKDRILYVCEGPTDTAAAITLGLPAVGRAACLGQVEDVRALMKRLGFSRVVAIADHDEAKTRPDGSVFYPGQDGAKKLLADLKTWAKMIVTPAKDLRAWLKDGATPELFAAIERQQIWRAS